MFRMFRRGRDNAPASNPVKPDALTEKSRTDNALVAKAGSALLGKHQALIDNIYSFSQLDKDRFAASYRVLFENVAQLVQELPASERHHHAYLGGLLEHSIEVATYCARISGRFLYTADGEEKILARSALYVFAMVSAGVIHDVGKALVDIDIVIISRTGQRTLWNPAMGLMPPGTRYIYRYSDKRQHGLHESAGVMMLLTLMPQEALRWIWEVSSIRNQWIASIGGQAMELGGRIGECLIECDSASTGAAMESAHIAHAVEAEAMTTGSTKVKVDDLLIKGIIKSFASFAPNTQGNPYWVSQHYVACIAPRFIEVAKAALGAQGAMLPEKDASSVLYDMLLDAGSIIPNPMKKAVHHLSFSDRAKPLAAILFKRAVLDPDNTLECHAGKLICPSCPEEFCHKEAGKQFAEGTTSRSDGQAPSPADQHSEESKAKPVKVQVPVQQRTNHQEEEQDRARPTKPMAPPVQEPAPELSSRKDNRQTNTVASQPGTRSDRIEQQPVSQVEETNTDEPVSINYGATQAFGAQDFKNYILNAATKDRSETTSSIRRQLAATFIDWLKFEVITGAMTINALGGPLHLTDEKQLAMVTPEIFSKFLASGRAGQYPSAKSSGQQNHTNRPNDRKLAVAQVQHAVQQYHKFQKSILGENMISCSVEGNRNKSGLHVMVFTISETNALGINLDNVKPNKYLVLQEATNF